MTTDDTGSPGGTLVAMKTWVVGDEVHMLTEWATEADEPCYVLQRCIQGSWRVRRSWEPSNDETATLLARALLGQVREL